jgi:hypothetical protein
LTGGGEGCWLGTMEKGGIMEAQKFKNDLKKLGGYTFIWFFFFLKTYVTIMEQLTTFSKQDS